MQWYYAVGSQQSGPVDQEVLFALARDGKLRPDDLVWNTTMGNQWAKASTVPGLFEGPASSEGAVQPPPVMDWSSTASCESRTPNRDLMTEARQCLAGNWGLGVATVLIYFALQILLNCIPVIGGLLSFVVSGPLTLGWMVFFMALARRSPASVGLMFSGFQRFWVAFLAALLTALLVFAWMLPGLVAMIATVAVGAKRAFSGSGPSPSTLLLLVPLGLLLVVVPAVIAQLRYSMAYFIIADDTSMTALDAIRRSTQMMRGNAWKLFCLQCRFIGWSLLCILTFGIGFLWLMPYVWTSTVRFYEDLVAGRKSA